MNLRETDHEVIVEVTLGWVVHGSISVRCVERVLQIEAECYAPPTATQVRPSGWRQGDTFKRAIAVPCDVCSGRAQARYRQGVLTIRIPKADAPAASDRRPS